MVPGPSLDSRRSSGSGSPLSHPPSPTRTFSEAFGASRSLQLPGFSVSVGDMAAALRRVGGETAYAHIAWQPDPLIQAIVPGWPRALATPRAEAMGFGRGSGIDEVLTAFLGSSRLLLQQLDG